MIDTKKLTSMNSVLSEKYGEEGTQSRIEFNAKAQAWYLAEVLKKGKLLHKSKCIIYDQHKKELFS